MLSIKEANGWFAPRTDNTIMPHSTEQTMLWLFVLRDGVPFKPHIYMKAVKHTPEALSYLTNMSKKRQAVVSAGEDFYSAQFYSNL